MTTFIPRGYGFNVGQDFARASEDTLINEPRFERGCIYGYIAGNPKSALGFMRSNRVYIRVMPCCTRQIGNDEGTNQMQDPHAVCRKWVRRIGLGFHPDTRGKDYSPAMSAAEIMEYDADMEALFKAAADPYECSIMAMTDAGLI